MQDTYLSNKSIYPLSDEEQDHYLDQLYDEIEMYARACTRNYTEEVQNGLVVLRKQKVWERVFKFNLILSIVTTSSYILWFIIINRDPTLIFFLTIVLLVIWCIRAFFTYKRNSPNNRKNERAEILVLRNATLLYLDFFIFYGEKALLDQDLDKNKLDMENIEQYEEAFEKLELNMLTVYEIYYKNKINLAKCSSNKKTITYNKIAKLIKYLKSGGGIPR